MSKGYRNGAFALGLITGGGIVLNLFLWAGEISQKQTDPEAQTQNRESSDQIVNAWDWLLGPFISPSDTLAQWIMAVLSGAAVGLLWFTLDASRRTLSATQGMAEDTREIGEAQIRPWLLPNDSKTYGGTDINADGARVPSVNFEITFSNFGNSPATGVVIGARYYLVSRDSNEPIDGFIPDIDFPGATVAQTQSVGPEAVIIDGNNRTRFLSGEQDVVVHARAYYEFRHDKSTRRFSEVSLRFVCVGEIKNKDGETYPHINVRPFGKQQYCH